MTKSRQVADFGAGGFTAGKNAVINGDFGVWQRGTSFSNPAFGAFAADRWFLSHDGTGATRTISQQTFTAGTAPVAGYEGTYFLRYAVSVAGTGNTANNLIQKIEDVRKFAGQTVTVSFWAKAAAADTYSAGAIAQDFGTGGSSTVYTSPSPTTFNLTTSWARYSYTVAVPSIAGKTIGTNSHFDVIIAGRTNSTFTLDLWGVQVEANSVATPFTTATGTVQGELAACQRYYYQSTNQTWTNLQNQANVAVSRGGTLFLPQFMRVAPTLTLFDSPGTSGRVSVSAASGGYSDNITPSMFGTDSLNSYAYYVGGSYVLGYTSKITASAEL